jgi:hypothetical protein
MAYMSGAIIAALAAPLFADDYQRRKQERRERFAAEYGVKMKPCTACNGSGHYDHNGAPKCYVCEGTGKVKDYA